ncbi:MAG: hypothetical protein E7430_09605 [Ruminococcaceae bacterium]|nr:hypothetical protein [Oscillospiraceae bacterium]
MKKFNRLLSVLLVVVMLAGLMTIAASATSQNASFTINTGVANMPVALSVNSWKDGAFAIVKTDSGITGADGSYTFSFTHDFKVGDYVLMAATSATAYTVSGSGGSNTNWESANKKHSITSDSGSVSGTLTLTGATLVENTTPSTEPSTTPSTEPSATPSTEPSTTPSAEPSATPSTEPSTTPSESQPSVPSEPTQPTQPTQPVTGEGVFTIKTVSGDPAAPVSGVPVRLVVQKWENGDFTSIYSDVVNTSDGQAVITYSGGLVASNRVYAQVLDSTGKWTQTGITLDSFGAGCSRNAQEGNEYICDIVGTAGITATFTLSVKDNTPPAPPVPPAEPEIKEVSVSLSSIVDKRLVLKDSLPFRFEETFNAVVYAQSNPNAKRPGGMPGPGGRPGMMPGRPYPDGYVNYRNLEYVATLEVSVAKMKNDPFFKYPMYYRIPDFRWNKTLTKDFTPVAGSDITALTFTEPGTYTYFVKELAGKTRFMSYDTEWKKVVISVTEVDGVLKASVKTAVITNVYDKSANFDADANSSVTLTKVDSVDKTKVLQGAKFKLYQEGKYKDYEYYNTYTTNYNGEIEIYNLAPGDYYFIEVAAPVGYELDDSKIEFTIGKTTKTNDVELTVTNKKINVFTEEHFAYIVGYEDGTVRPQNNITRAEAATILFRLLNDDVRSKYWDTASSYADVSVNAWYNNAVATLENMGVLEAGANYRPNDYITRAELVFMITNFYDMAELDIEGIAITDISGHVYEAAIKQAAAMGWVKGYTDGSFNPDANITRAEAMTMINRVLCRAVEERGMCAGMKTFIDNPVSAWYYEDVQEATNSHTYTRTTTLVEGYDFYYESWGSIEANRDWAALEATWAK